MLGVTLGDKHSFHDLRLWLKRYPLISTPQPKTKFVDVPGADGGLDLAKALTGQVQYHRRTITMEFTIAERRDKWPEIHSDIMDQLHGKDVDIILDDDPEYCYTGQLTVSDPEPDKVTSGITITADVEPYKTRLQSTRRSVQVDGISTVTIMGNRKPVIPAITASAAMQMTFGGRTYDLPAGESTFADIIIREGMNTFTFTGSGGASLEYREGRF